MHWTLVSVFFLAMVYVCEHCQFHAETKRNLNIHTTKGCTAHVTEDSGFANALERAKAKRQRKREREREAKRQRIDEPVATNVDGNEVWEDIGGGDPMADEVGSNTPPTEPPPLGRTHRAKRPTWKVLQNQRSTMAPPIPSQQELSHTLDGDLPAASSTPEPTVHQMWNPFRSAINLFGLFREYVHQPTHDPNTLFSADAPSTGANDPVTHSSDTADLPPALQHDLPLYHPFSNATSFGFLHWKWTGANTKSDIETGKLLSFLRSDDFNRQDITAFNIATETRRIDKYINGDVDMELLASSSVPPGHGEWKESTVSISVPDGKEHDATDELPKFEVPSLHHRSLTDIIRNTFSDADKGKYFHYVPYKHHFQPPAVDSILPPPTRVYDEIYSSDAMIGAHDELQRQPPEPNCTLERVIAAVMLYSDSTHLASFGTASAWPIYMSFGNESKYVRCKPQTGSCHHLAYIPKLPDTFYEFVTNLTGEGPTTDLLAHARRELMHAIWSCILDDDFQQAYEHGLIIQCPDGVSRRFYPRIFTYSADYPEKVLLTTIRNFGACPCPRCLVPKDKIPELGTVRDETRRSTLVRVDDARRRGRISQVRDWIYRAGRAIKSKAVELVIGTRSEVPTSNAFSERLSQFGFDFHSMFVPDLLHEIELGTWKALFTHLIRILVANGGTVIQKLNDSYRSVPTFGRSTIRRFHNNASSMKKLAARDFEDLLQCAMPVFEGLLNEPHDANIQKLLFTVAEYHALAKLRMHTEETLVSLTQATKDLGRQLRSFASTTCMAFDTKELPKEEAARGRRQSRKKQNATPAAAPESAAKGPKTRRFNMATYKHHSLGDYVKSIRQFGTTDSYSTQPGELQHRRLKVFYVRTSKNKALRQMTKHEAHERVVRTVFTKVRTVQRLQRVVTKAQLSQSELLGAEAKPYHPLEQHHHMSTSTNSTRNIFDLIRQYPNDPALDLFIPKLKKHLLSRLLHPNECIEDEDFSREEWNEVQILGDRLYVHKTLRVNYTTYDVHGAQDSINSRTHPDVMTLKQQDHAQHPFDYARVIGIFHVRVQHEALSPDMQELDVLWVRNFCVDTTYRSGLKQKRLTRLAFVPGTEAFGFLSPDEVIRGSHVIPAFAYGPTKDLLGPTVARQCFSGDIVDKAFVWPKEPDEDDYRYYYVNFFVDRDMYMRYHGGGIGHYKVEVMDIAGVGGPEDADHEEEIVADIPADSGSESDSEDEERGSDASVLSDTEGDDTDSEVDADRAQLEENILGYDQL